MKLLTNSEALDKRTIGAIGISSILLMENAGRSVADAVFQHVGHRESEHQNVLIVCGPGNNGGDGFVCARQLAMKGIKRIDVWVTAASEQLKGDAQFNFNLMAYWPAIHVLQDIPTMITQHYDVIVDALFGSGLKRPLDEQVSLLVADINAYRKHHDHVVVLSVDVPSGVASCTGEVMGVSPEQAKDVWRSGAIQNKCIYADETITFATGKPGQFLFPGKAACGTVHVVDIGIPTGCIEAQFSEEAIPTQLITPALLKAWLPQKPPMGHKYTYGHVLVIGGSAKMPGAPVMAVGSAFEAGCGLVTLAAPQGVFVHPALQPEAMQLTLPEGKEGEITCDAMLLLADYIAAKKINTIAIGPGLGQSTETELFFQAFLNYVEQHFSGQVVVDADGLNLLSKVEVAKHLNQFVLTPHLGEASRLLNKGIVGKNASVLQIAEQLQMQYGATIVLKSASTVIAENNSNESNNASMCWISPVTDPSLAVAGSGDKLTGRLASYLAQGCLSYQAAALATSRTILLEEPVKREQFYPVG